MSANHKPSWSALSQSEASLSPSENQSSPDSPRAVLCNEVGTTRYMEHGTLLYDRSLGFVSFYGFPKPIKNTQSLHWSFLSCQWVSCFDLKISLGHYLNNLVPNLNQACLVPILQFNIPALIFLSEQSEESWKCKEWPLVVYIRHGGGHTGLVSNIFTTKIKSDPSDIILSIGLVLGSQAWIPKIRINRDHSIESRS